MAKLRINPPLKGRTYHFETAQDLIDVKEEQITNEVNLSNWKNIKTYSGENWYGHGLKNHDMATEAISKGWKYGNKKVEEMTSQIKLPQLESVKRRNVRGREGDMLDIHKVNSGQLDRAWTARKRTSKQTAKRFTITANIGANSNVNSDVLFWRGVATCALTNALVTAGHAVEVIAYTTNTALTEKENQKSPYEMFHTIGIKSFTTPLNLASLVASICMAGFFRTCIFKAWLTDPEDCRPGLGHATNSELPQEVLNRNGVIISVPVRLKNSTDVERWLNETAREI